jgi:hypothetical protein
MNHEHGVQMPISYLSIRKTQIYDNGFKTLLQRFESIQMRLGNKEITEGIILDFSENQLGESSIRVLSNLLEAMPSSFKGILMENLGQA